MLGLTGTLRLPAQVTELYRRRIPEDSVVLDLMSSWVSHLPDGVRYRRVIGHGMNAQEVRCMAVQGGSQMPCTPRIQRLCHFIATWQALAGVPSMGRLVWSSIQGAMA